MIRKLFICIIYSILLTIPVLAQRGPVPFARLQDSMAAHPKPIVIKIYTDWCSYCKMQDMQIRRSPALQQLLSDEYYYLTLDAESRQPIVFNDTTYSFISYGTQGIHALAAKLMQHHTAYPAWIVLDTSYRMKAFQAGMLNDRSLLAFLRSIE